MTYKTRFWLTVACSVAITALFFAAVAFASYQLPLSGKARVTYVDSGAQLNTESGPVSLVTDMELVAPCKVSTGAAKLELLMPDGSVLRFAPQSEFELVSAVANSQNRQVEVDVAVGDAWATVESFLGGDSEFDISSPTAVAGVAGTKYRVKVNTARKTSIFVHEGKVEVGKRWTPQGTPKAPADGEPVRVQGPSKVAGPQRVDVQTWTRLVSVGFRFDVSAAGSFAEPVRFDLQEVEKEEWVRWNQQRDKAMGR